MKPPQPPCRALPLVLLLSLGSLAAPLVAGRAQRGDPPAGVPTGYREAAVRGDWEAAAGAARELAAGVPERADLALYLEARALRRARRADEALARLAGFEEQHARSPWLHAASFLRAELVAELGRMEEAQRAWELETERLRSPERKGELALRLVELAAQRTRPREAGDPRVAAPQHDRALVLLEGALALEPPRPIEDRARYDLARARVGLGQPREAIDALRDYLARFDPTERTSRAAREGAGRWVFEARLELGRQLLAAGDRSAARRTFEGLLAAARTARADGAGRAGLLPSEPEDRIAALEQLAQLEGEAAFALHGTYAATGDEGFLAIGALRRYLEAFPHHGRGSEALARIAALLEGLGRHAEALDAYAELAASSAPSGAGDAQREAHARLVREAHFARGRLLAAQRRFAEAREAFELYVARFPSGERWSEAQRGVLDAQIGLGEVLRAQGRHAQAREALRRFLEEQPLDPRAAHLALELGETFVEEADALQAALGLDAADEVEALLRQALGAWQAVPAKHPGSEEASRAMLRRGEILETRLADLEAAIQAYRAVTFGRWQSAAGARLSALLAESLVLRTERTYRSDEPARITLQTRNLERARIDVFALDLESYFARHRTHLGVERLDLDLIAPDRTSEVALADYRPYAPLERELDLELAGVGVWAVAVSAGDLRATTLVIRSDLELIQKTSQREVFVFVQDMLRGTPAAGVGVLVARQGQGGEPGSLTQLETDEEGIARLALAELGGSGSRGEGEVRVLALREGHVAAEGTSLSGLGLGIELGSRGLVYTDRPIYRPGDGVRWRAIVREARDGVLDFTPGDAYRIEVLGPGGVALFSEVGELSAFGTLHGALDLPELASPGDYGIRVRRGADAYTARFRVEPYRVQRVELLLEPARRVVHHGGTVEVRAQARYLHGEPLVGAVLAVTSPDGSRRELTTDAAGAASFELDTRDHAVRPDGGESVLRVTALLAEENLLARAEIHVIQREFTLALDLRRDVVLAGEPFVAAVRAVAADGTPVGRELTLSVLRRVSGAGGTWSEVLVEEHALATDAASGQADATIVLTRGGSYLLRAQGTDGSKNPIQAQGLLRVAGEGDEERLRWIVADLRVPLGAALEPVLADRDGGGLALVTIEAERVLGYRLIELRQGPNAVPFEAASEHAPNVVLSATILDGRRMHQASVELEVSRELRVELELDRDGHVPGETARVRVRTLDGLGRPVRAELSLAVVDEALLARHPQDLPRLARHFGEAGRRAAGMATASSVSFRYQGATARVAADILAEAERRKAEELWDARRGEVLERLEVAHVQGRDGDAWQLPEDDVVLAESEPADLLGIGGGSAGRFGGRMGGVRGGPATPGPGDPLPRETEPDPDTAYWIADLVTGEDGRAEVELVLPPRSTRWRLLSLGADAGASFGEATESLTARAELSAELRAPLALFEGDRPRIAARLFAEGLTGEARLTLHARRGEVRRSLPATVQLDGRAVVEHLFGALDPVLLGAAGPGPNDPTGAQLVLELDVEARVDARGVDAQGVDAQGVDARGAERLRARARESVAILPYGIELGDAASGPLTELVVRELTLPAAGPYTSRRILLRVGSGIETLLLDEALGRGPDALRGCAWLPPDPATDLIGVATLQRLWSARAAAGGVDPRALAERASALIARLVAAQRSDGGFSALGPDAPPDEKLSARALWAFLLAQRADLPVDAQVVERALAFAQAAMRGASQRAPELEAALLHALALHGRGDFAVANRLHRQRASLSTQALAHTALALAAMQSLPLAEDLAALLEERGPWEVESRPGSSLEAAALALLALEEVRPRSAHLEGGVELLLAQRPWRASGARGLALAAVAERRAQVVSDKEPLEVDLEIEGRDPVRLALGPADPTVSHELDLGAGPGGRVRVTLRARGRGTPHYALVLSGISAEMSARPAAAFELLERSLLAPPPLLEGRELPTGFSVLERHEAPWANLVQSLELGARATLRIAWQRRLDPRAQLESEAQLEPRAQLESGTRRDRRAPLIVDLPLPAGARVLPGGVRGGLAHEVREGRAIFHLAPDDDGGRLEVDLVGLVPGRYRVPPPLLYDADLPRERAVGTPGELTVLARGERSDDAYRPTPDERYHRGLVLFARGSLAEAAATLSALLDDHGAHLRDEPLRRLAWVLFRADLESGDAAAVVRSFELLRERDPERVLAAPEVVEAARAYRVLGEHERSGRLFRAVIEESFLVDLAAVRALAEQGQTAAAFALQGRLVLEHPDLAVVLHAHLDLAARLLAAAPDAARDASLRRAGLDRAELVLGGVLHLERFLAFHPRDPLAPEAGLDLVHALFELRDYDRAARLCSELAASYALPMYRDAFRYAGALARWELGELEAARRLFREVAEAVYTDARGTAFASPNRGLARYLLAQIAHAEGDAPAALLHYGEVERDFPDARAALEDLRREELELDEVTSGTPGAPIELELRHRNVARAELLVYAVDLLTLYLREKDLSQVTQVELAGIEPTLRQGIDLEPGPHLRARTSRVPLSLPRPGAYLVIARGTERFTSALVLSSDLELEVREDAAAGTLRVQAFERSARAEPRFAAGVDVRVVGSEGGAIRSGTTDRRGLFSAEGIRGRPTVVARLGSHYAFHRGTAALRQGPPARDRSAAPTAAPPEYLQNLRLLHRSSQATRRTTLETGLQTHPGGLRMGELQ